jgi:hypothetical protein
MDSWLERNFSNCFSRVVHSDVDAGSAGGSSAVALPAELLHRRREPRTRRTDGAVRDSESVDDSDWDGGSDSEDANESSSKPDELGDDRPEDDALLAIGLGLRSESARLASDLPSGKGHGTRPQQAGEQRTNQSKMQQPVGPLRAY